MLKIIEGVVTGIVDNGYFLIDPETGKPTKLLGALLAQ